MVNSLKLLDQLTVVLFLVVFLGFWIACGHGIDAGISPSPLPEPLFEAAQRGGRIEDRQLVECSGIDISLAGGDHFWAINDSGDGPFLYALGRDGRSFGRVRVAGAHNRDWEDLATFLWQGRPMILVADTGDNRQRPRTHTLYVVPEPLYSSRPYDASAMVEVAWRIVFSYPDRGHDAEAVAVDTAGGKVLILTKRDNPPLLFELPLGPSSTDAPLIARKVATVSRIPPPTVQDKLWPYGNFRSQPTALDLSEDGRHAVVLTYKHAYLFERNGGDSWSTAFTTEPALIALPLPQESRDLGQREAICFAADGRSLVVTAEGQGAGIYRLAAFQ